MWARRIGGLIGAGMVLSLAYVPESLAGEKCSSESVETMRQALAEGSARPACEDVERAIQLLPVSEISSWPGWEYTGERTLRAELKKKFGIQVTPRMMPLGYVERPNGSVLVFAYDVSGVLGRRWPLMSLIAEFQSRTPESGQETRFILGAVGERSYFTRVALYPKAAHGLRRESNWVRFHSFMSTWGATDKERPARSKNCFSCTGWLCAEGSVVCLGDYDRTGIEQMAFRTCGPEVCGVTTVWGDQKGTLNLALTTTQPGGWEQRSGETLYIGAPACESGPGLTFCGFQSGCTPGRVYLRNKKTRAYQESSKWASRIYPVETRVAPSQCRVEHAEGILVMSEGRKFIRFVSK
jgi:hypothetical protein